MHPFNKAVIKIGYGVGVVFVVMVLSVVVIGYFQ